MVLSIRKISFENDDLAGQGIWWFKNLNEADPYLILPILATVLNYINLGVSNHVFNRSIERNHERQRALVREPIPLILLSPPIPAFAIHTSVAGGGICILDQLQLFCDDAVVFAEEALLFE